MSDPLCAQGYNPEMWFPGRDDAERPAKAICQRCPLQTACLTIALDDPTLAGIWGGTNETERKKMREGSAA